MIKIGIDNFNHQKPVDNCVDFKFENTYPCDTGFIIGHLLDRDHFKFESIDISNN